MNRNRIVTACLAIAIALATATAIALASKESDMAKEEIKAVVEASYVNGAFNAQNTEAMRMGFHPVFKIHGVTEEGAIRLYPIDDWIAAIEEQKARPGYQRESWEHRFPIIDVTGNAAIVKVELFKDSRHIFTDYLSLLKFEDGWKITDKVYHRHAES